MRQIALDDNRSKLDFTYKNCSRIDFFAVEKYQPDTRDSTDESTNVIPCEYHPASKTINKQNVHIVGEKQTGKEKVSSFI